jgi:predicted porin
MSGGFRGAASRLALAAVLGAAGSGALMHKPAKAADLGGDCCSDLEERVAELEATTARKGNKKVSVTVYGKANHAILFWDDGHEKNVYVVDNSYESSRFGFKGTAKIGGDWYAGYKMEMEDLSASSNSVNQINDDNAPVNVDLHVRHSYFDIGNTHYGELRLGLTSMPKDDIVKDTNVTDLEDTMFSDNHMMRSFFLRPKGFNTEVGNTLAPAPPPPGNSTLTWKSISECYSNTSDAFDCSTRRNAVTYWSPSFLGSAEGKGFTASWGWGEDDIWSAALRYKDNWGPNWEAGGGVAYEHFTDERVQNGGGGLAGFKQDIDEWAGSGSIKHMPTGLFVFGAFSTSDDNASNRNNAGIFTGKGTPTMTAWDAQMGIQRKFGVLGTLGDSSFFGGYSQINDGLGGIGANAFLKPLTFPNLPIGTEITGSQVARWYLGFDQAIDSAALHLYAVYQHLTADVDLVDQNLNRVNEPLDNFDLFYTGARMYF